jgi:hypothetical protein
MKNSTRKSIICTYGVPQFYGMATTNHTLARDLWTALPNTLTLTNGVARATNVDTVPQPRFFIVSEPR